MYNINSGYGQLDAFGMASRSPIHFGKKRFVVKSTDTDNYNRIQQMYPPDPDGTNRLFTTITAALAEAQDNDTIYVGPGVFEEGAELVISQANLKLIGSNTSGICWGPCSIKGSANHLISVQANGVEIAGLGFIQNGAYVGIEIDHTAAVYKTHIHDCHFGGSATATYGVKAGGTADAVDTVVEDCEFLSWATAAIYLNGTRSKARRNLIFSTVASAIGIEYVPTTGTRPYGLIDSNILEGMGTTDVAISFAGSPTKGTVMCSRNYMGGYATTIAQAAGHEFDTVNNYTASDAGGTLIDTVVMFASRASIVIEKLMSKVKVIDTGGVTGGGHETDLTGRTIPFSTTVKSLGLKFCIALFAASNASKVIAMSGKLRPSVPSTLNVSCA